MEKRYYGTLPDDAPDNYVPVPGFENQFMVLGDDGSVESYAERELLGGTWVWKEAEPSAIDVPGSDGLFAVVCDDGSLVYYRYEKGNGGSYSFVMTDADGTPIG